MRKVGAALEEPELEVVSSEDPIKAFANSEEVSHFFNLLQRAESPSTVEIIRLRFLEEKSVSEVALQLGLSEEQVRVQTWRGLQKLRSKSQDTGSEGQF